MFTAPAILLYPEILEATFTLRPVVCGMLLPLLPEYQLINCVTDVHFYFHHAMIDLVYSTWQSLDFPHRQQVIAGGTRMFDDANNSTRQTLEDVVDLEVLNVDGKKYKIKELVSTVRGPFCYLYQ